MICLDTMVLIWGVQGRATPGQEEMVARAQRFLSALGRDNERILIATPSIAEYLQHFEETDRRRQLAVLERHFLIAPFDLPAAYFAAGLARGARGLRPDGEISRQAVKTDVQIIATAVVHGANRLITYDQKHFEKLAAGRIQVTGIPDLPEQASLDLAP